MDNEELYKYVDYLLRQGGEDVEAYKVALAKEIKRLEAELKVEKRVNEDLLNKDLTQAYITNLENEVSTLRKVVRYKDTVLQHVAKGSLIMLKALKDILLIENTSEVVIFLAQGTARDALKKVDEM